jgi:hypothetical protein
MDKVIVSTGGIPQAHQVLDVAFAHGSSADGFLKTANPLEAYTKVTDILREQAAAMGGNAVIHTTFDYRVAVSPGQGGEKALEVFAYGTVVRAAPVPGQP